MNANAGECLVLVLFDLSTAADTVNHSIIIERLRTWVGISETALQWFSSYRKCVVSVGFTSSQALSLYGVLQSSIVGPILYSLYLPPFGPHYQTAWFLISLLCRWSSAVLVLQTIYYQLIAQLCLRVGWKVLQFNSSKTEILIIGPEHSYGKVP